MKLLGEDSFSFIRTRGHHGGDDLLFVKEIDVITKDKEGHGSIHQLPKTILKDSVSLCRVLSEKNLIAIGSFWMFPLEEMGLY